MLYVDNNLARGLNKMLSFPKDADPKSPGQLPSLSRRWVVSRCLATGPARASAMALTSTVAACVGVCLPN